MIIVSTSSTDTYITNKFVDGISKTTANVGRSGTLDLFKLFNHPSAPALTTELSRILIKFDYRKLSELVIQNRINLNDMVSILKLKSIIAGQSIPQNFTVSVFPLAKQFDEGIGRDIISFSDVDQANFLSSSTNTSWNLTGSSLSGTLGDTNIDYYYQGDLLDGNGIQTFEITQSFIDGDEDLEVNISKFVSASIAGNLTNHGFRISFSFNHESDQNNYFAKRFSSRHVKNSFQRPRIENYFNDFERDDRELITFNSTGSLYLTNQIGGERTRFISGSSPVQGENCLLLTISTGSFETTFNVSESSYRQGTYFANVFVSSYDNSIVTGSISLSQIIQASSSVTFHEKWTSLDQSVVFQSNDLTINSSRVSQGIFENFELSVFTSGPETGSKDSFVLIRPKFYDLVSQDRSSKFAFVKKPIPIKGTYRIVDNNTGEVYVDFNDLNQMSYDSNGNYFEIHTDSIPYGRVVNFEYKINYLGNERILKDRNYTFRLGE